MALKALGLAALLSVTACGSDKASVPPILRVLNQTDKPLLELRMHPAPRYLDAPNVLLAPLAPGATAGRVPSAPSSADA